MAAGQARRMGCPKQLLLLGGKPAVWHVAHAACQAGLEEVLLVSGAYRQEVEGAVAGLPVRAVYNEKWQQGQSASVKQGVEQLKPEVRGVLFLLADQPLLSPSLILQMVGEYRRQAGTIIVPRCRGRIGNPVLFDLDRWRRELLGLTGDEGARRFIRQQPQEVAYVDVEEEAVFMDMDTPEEYENMCRLWGRLNPE